MVYHRSWSLTKDITLSLNKLKKRPFAGLFWYGNLVVRLQCKIFMERESIDLDVVIKSIDNLIDVQYSKQHELLKSRMNNTDKNICVTIYSKYLKRLFTLKFAVEDQIKLRKRSIDRLPNDHAKNEVLEAQFLQSRFDFYFGIFSLFEDLVATITEHVLTKKEYGEKKSIL